MKIFNKIQRKAKIVLAIYLIWCIVHFVLFIGEGPIDYTLELTSHGNYSHNDSFIDVRTIWDMDNSLWPAGYYDIADLIFYIFTPIILYIIIELFRSARKDKKKGNNDMTSKNDNNILK